MMRMSVMRQIEGGMKMLNTGTKAPQFTLNDRDGNAVSLSDFLGKKVVVYFYPKDDTPGCTKQACAFAGAYEDFKSLNAVVIGISKDSEDSHRKFAEKYGLNFVLLSDPDTVAIQAYDVWQTKTSILGVERSTYIIDEEGVIEKALPNVKPDTNAAEILEYLRAGA
jgi:peroxiredoxin Q/BCP